jgi:formate hydrogenlyase subunit 6/NADH:ubiquinone oxidoreductase subunit I
MVQKDGGNVTKCIACGICVKACPMEILEIVEK